MTELGMDIKFFSQIIALGWVYGFSIRDLRNIKNRPIEQFFWYESTVNESNAAHTAMERINDILDAKYEKLIR